MQDIVMYILMCIVTACTYIAYVPQIVKLIKTKKSNDLSLGSWALWVVSSLSSVTYGIMLGRLELVIADLSEVILELLVLFLSIRYRSNIQENK